MKFQWEGSPHTEVLYKRSRIDLEPEVLGIDVENSFFAYLFLVENESQKIRWRGCGPARQGELDTISEIIQAANKFQPPLPSK